MEADLEQVVEVMDLENAVKFTMTLEQLMQLFLYILSSRRILGFEEWLNISVYPYL